MLRKGRSDAAIRANIAYLIHKEGKPPMQAVAIAYAKAGRSRRKHRKGSFYKNPKRVAAGRRNYHNSGLKKLNMKRKQRARKKRSY